MIFKITVSVSECAETYILWRGLDLYIDNQ